MDIGTSFGGIGASREVMIASLAEPAMLMIVLSVALIAGSTQLPPSLITMAFSAVGLRVSLALGLVAFIVVALAENARIPVDNPATSISNSPWSMRRWCWNTPAPSGDDRTRRLAEAVLYVSVSRLPLLPVRSPGWLCGGTDRVPGWRSWDWPACLLGVFGILIAKMRAFRVPNFLGAALMLSLLGVLLLFVSGGM